MPPQSPGGRDSRVLAWASARGRVGQPARLAARFDGGQVAAEILNIFRETPEFGRSLGLRIEPFLDESAEGTLRLIGGGGEASVFYDADSQRVIKLFAPPCKARYGWVLCRDASGEWSIGPGNLEDAVMRFSVFEEMFQSGLELDECGSGGEYLTLSQPFIAGHHPERHVLHEWMASQGWEYHPLQSGLPMLRDLTWCRGNVLATDVRPENALVSELDGSLTAIDFICGMKG